MSQVGPYCLTDNGGFGRTPRRACPQPVIFQAEEVPQRQTDMIPLGTGGAVLGAFDTAVLRAPAMVRFDPPPVPGILRPLVGTHARSLVAQSSLPPAGVAIATTVMKPSPVRCTTAPVAGIGTSLIGRLPDPSGSTRR